MAKTYDLLVIGAGMAGVAAANKCASQGWNVAIVDAQPYGGTCALRGCDPKKILRRGAEIIDSARLMRGKGIDDPALTINWQDLMKHKRGFTDPVPHNLERDLASHGVDTLHGQARFLAKNRVDIAGARLEAGHFLIATGAHPRPLDFPGHEHLIDSTDFLNLDTLPPRILFVGGGFISFEFAHIAARAGSTPTVIDRGPRPLKGFDPDLVDLLIGRSQQAGIAIRPSTTITAVDKTCTGYRVSVESSGVAETIECDRPRGRPRSRPCRPRPRRRRCRLGSARGERRGPPAEHHQPRCVRRRRLGRHSRIATDTGGRVRRKGRRVQHGQRHDADT